MMKMMIVRNQILQLIYVLHNKKKIGPYLFILYEQEELSIIFCQSLIFILAIQEDLTLVIPLIGVYKYDLFALHQLVTSNKLYNKEISNCSVFNILPGATTHYVDHRQHFQPCKFETTQIRFDPISIVLKMLQNQLPNFSSRY